MRPWLTTIFDLLGASLIVIGIWLVFIPAALVVAGLACLLISWRATRA